ncbi:hypothetical protein QBC46DRAFT_336072 [Diplogelasinospora grovesii]|uniref:Uncharacterized protein n=1 Tax=Diplogelasinospora grovesii TaxID=303347 RepID=A0AAN6S9Y1_9PEZI|nr:hypothetical protein QBC46DRAFT_336072 [Diplogelasinospora grovesii]
MEGGPIWWSRMQEITTVVYQCVSIVGVAFNIADFWLKHKKPKVKVKDEEKDGDQGQKEKDEGQKKQDEGQKEKDEGQKKKHNQLKLWEDQEAKDMAEQRLEMLDYRGNGAREGEENQGTASLSAIIRFKGF